MPQSTSIEANEYSRWDDDDIYPQGYAVEAADEGRGETVPAALELIVDAGAKGDRLDKWVAGRLSSAGGTRVVGGSPRRGRGPPKDAAELVRKIVSALPGPKRLAAYLRGYAERSTGR